MGVIEKDDEDDEECNSLINHIPTRKEEKIYVTPVIENPGKYWVSWMSLFYHNMDSNGLSTTVNYALIFAEIIMMFMINLSNEITNEYIDIPGIDYETFITCI